MSEFADEYQGSEAKGVGPGLKARILLVDDEILIRLVAREILENQGYVVQEAVDGQEGLELFLEHAHEVDLVILDLVMPRLHGYQVMDRIREVAPTVPILLSSGYTPNERPECLQATNVLGFLPKPYRSHELTTEVARLLGQTPA